jgi:hypothetical protein
MMLETEWPIEPAVSRTCSTTRLITLRLALLDAVLLRAAGRFADAVLREADRLLLRLLVLLRFFPREEALRLLARRRDEPDERFLDADFFLPRDFEPLREDDLFFAAIRFLLVRTCGGGTRRSVGNGVA